MKYFIQASGFLIAMLSVCSVYGQVTIQPLRPGGSLASMDQIFEVQVINTFPEQVSGELVLVIKDQTSRQIASTSSYGMTLGPGEVVGPSEIEWRSELAINDYSEANRLLYGNSLGSSGLAYCFRFIAEDRGGVIGRYCFENTLLQLRPPRLIFPRNGAKLTSTLPTFSWHPVMAIAPGKVDYHLKVVELEKGQSLIDAMRGNFPLVDASFIKSLSYIYPSSGIKLDESKAYAWQVEAMLGEKVIGATEIWRFSFRQEKPKEEEITEGAFRRMRGSVAGLSYSCEDELRFSYEHHGVNQLLSYRIYELTNVGEAVGNLPEIKIKNGDNNIVLALDNGTQFKHDVEYVLEVMDAVGNKMFLPFVRTKK